MDLTEAINLIGSLGFPMAAWLLMWRMTNDTLAKLNDTISNNTITIQKLADEISYIRQTTNVGGETNEV